MANARNTQRIRVVSGLALTLVASAVIWSKLRLVGDVPRRAFAEPETVLVIPAPEPACELEPARQSEPVCDASSPCVEHDARH